MRGNKNRAFVCEWSKLFFFIVKWNFVLINTLVQLFFTLMSCLVQTFLITGHPLFNDASMRSNSWICFTRHPPKDRQQKEIENPAKGHQELHYSTVPFSRGWKEAPHYQTTMAFALSHTSLFTEEIFQLPWFCY